MSAKEKINHAHGRNTNDYTPTMPGGKEEMAAINARREMLNVLAMPSGKHKGTGSISKASKIGIRSRAKAK